MLLGGPAVPGHREIITAVTFHEQGYYAECNSAIDALAMVNPMYASLKGFVSTTDFLKIAQVCYYGLIKKEYDKIKSVDPSLCKIRLNHNLVFDCSLYIQHLA